MRKFRFRNTSPPGGYTYQVPFSGEWVEAGDLAQLVLRVRAAYVRNGTPLPADLAARIEHSICLRVPESFCHGEYEPGDEQMKLVTPREVRDATGRIRLKWAPDRFLAPGDLVARRAETCSRCRLNHKGFCTVCNGLLGYVKDAIGDRPTPLEDQLGICSVCSCILKAKVHVSKEALQAALKPGEKYPDHCWMVTEEVVPHG